MLKHYRPLKCYNFCSPRALAIFATPLSRFWINYYGYIRKNCNNFYQLHYHIHVLYDQNKKKITFKIRNLEHYVYCHFVYIYIVMTYDVRCTIIIHIVVRLQQALRKGIEHGFFYFSTHNRQVITDEFFRVFTSTAQTKWIMDIINIIYIHLTQTICYQFITFTINTYT